MRYFILLMALVLSSCSHDDSQVNNGWVIYDLLPLEDGCIMYYGEDERISIFYNNNCWCQGDVSDAFKDLMPDNATWATKEEFDKAPVVGHIIEGIGLVFTDRGGHEVNA